MQIVGDRESERDLRALNESCLIVKHVNNKTSKHIKIFELEQYVTEPEIKDFCLILLSCWARVYLSVVRLRILVALLKKIIPNKNESSLIL